LGSDTVIDLSGMRAFLESDGEGPCVFFIHGQGGDLRTWDRIWPFLPRNRRLVRYDLRGFGGSVATTDQRYRHSQDLVELLDALSIEKIDLVGVSMGGGIALSFALDHPFRVRSLILISPQIAGWEWSVPWRVRWQSIVDAARSGRMVHAKQLWWDHPMFASIRNTEAAADLRDEIERFEGKQWIADGHALVMPDIERLHELRSPTLLLSGGRDMDEFHLMADIIAASSEAVDRVDLENAGHLLHMEQPQSCAGHMVAFWERRSPA
jgi:pimeloyl-ACP methyl ester carboxylesterase